MRSRVVKFFCSKLSFFLSSGRRMEYILVLHLHFSTSGNGSSNRIASYHMRRIGLTDSQVMLHSLPVPVCP